MSPIYKLTYFNSKALAEPIRLLFAYADVEYEDIRIEHADWPQLKPQTPWSVLPILEEDGKQLSQSAAIFRYLGRKFNLAGADPFQSAKCDEYIDAVGDIRLEATKYFGAEEGPAKEEAKKKFVEETLPKGLKKFNEILTKNGTGFLVGKELTHADIFVAYFLDFLAQILQIEETIQNDFPAIVVHQKRAFSNPGIQAWIKKRPVTQY